MNDIDVREFLASVAGGPEPAIGLDPQLAMQHAQRSVRRTRLRIVSAAAAVIAVSLASYGLTQWPRSTTPTIAVAPSESPSPTPDIAPFTVDVSSGSAFAQSLLPAVTQAMPGAEVSVIKGEAQPDDWGGPVYGASYLVSDHGDSTTVYVDAGAASAAGYSAADPQTPCEVVGANDQCSPVPDGEVRTTAPHGDQPGQVAATASDVVVRWVARGGAAPVDVDGLRTLAVARAIATAMPQRTLTPEPGPSGMPLLALQTWVDARALLAPYGATTWASSRPYSGDPRSPASVLFHLPGGQVALIYVLAQDSYKKVAPPAVDEVVRDADAANGWSFEVHLPADVFDATQTQQLANLLAGLTAEGVAPTTPTPSPIVSERESATELQLQRTRLQNRVLALTTSYRSSAWYVNLGYQGEGTAVEFKGAGTEGSGVLDVQVAPVGSDLCHGYQRVATSTCTRTRLDGRDVGLTRTPKGITHGIELYGVVIRGSHGLGVEVESFGPRIDGHSNVPLTLAQAEDLAAALAASYL